MFNVPLHRFWTTGPIFLTIWQKYSSTVVQTAFYLSIGEVWENIFIGESKFNSHFHILNKKSAFLSKKSGSSKLQSTCRGERFEENYLCEQIKFFRSFSDFELKNSGTKSKKIRHLWQKCFLRLQKNGSMIAFLRKKDSLHNVLTYLQKIIQNWRQTFWLNCQWFNLSVQGNNLREVIFWRRMKLSNNFVLWAKRFRIFDKKKSCKLVQIAFHVSRLTFWGVSLKKFYFFSTFLEN